MTIKTTQPNETVTIPTHGAGYDFEIDWGAGGIPATYAGNAPTVSYQYLNP
jgi:hypothetical protein